MEHNMDNSIHYRFTYPTYIDGLLEDCKTREDVDLKLTQITNNEPRKFEYIQDVEDVCDDLGYLQDIIFHNKLVDKGSTMSIDYWEPGE